MLFLRVIILAIVLQWGTILRGYGVNDSGVVRFLDPGLTLISDPQYFKGPLTSLPPVGSTFESFAGLDKNKALNIVSENDIWIRLVVNNAYNEDSVYAIRCSGYIERLNVFIEEGRQWKQLDTKFPEKSGINASLYWPTIFINLPHGQSTIYIHSERGWLRSTIHNIDVLKKEDVLNDRKDFLVHPSYRWTIYFLCAFCALLIFQLVYVTMQWYYHRTREYIDYALYLACILIYFLIRFDLYYHSELGLWTENFFRKFLNDLLLLLPYIFYLRFARFFIGMEEKFPEMNSQVKTVEKLLMFLIVPFLLSVFSGSNLIGAIATFSIMIPLFFYTLYMIWYFYRRRDKLIRFLLLGSLFAATGHFLAMTTSYLTFAFDVVPIYFTMIGLTFEIFFFNTGLGYKAKYEQEEKIKAQQVYINQLNENRKMQDHLQGMRNKIAGDLHDDVGSTLSSIGLYSQVASGQLNENPVKVKEILQKISASSQRMMEAMSDIVWAIHSKNDAGSELFGRMRNYMNDRLASMAINYSLDISPDVGNVNLTMEAKRNLLLFFKEAVNNAAKYSRAKTITAGMRRENEFLYLYIHDDGLGFERSSIREGTGLHSMESRASAMNGRLIIDSSPGNGTKLTLVVPVGSVSMHLYSNPSL